MHTAFAPIAVAIAALRVFLVLFAKLTVPILGSYLSDDKIDFSNI